MELSNSRFIMELKFSYETFRLSDPSHESQNRCCIVCLILPDLACRAHKNSHVRNRHITNLFSRFPCFAKQEMSSPVIQSNIPLHLGIEDLAYSLDERLHVIGKIFQSVGISAIIWGVDALSHHAISTVKSVISLISLLIKY